MRNIEVSTQVFSLIWSNRVDGEETEDQILRRLLNSTADRAEWNSSLVKRQNEVLKDKRSGTVFENGFTVFRNYKGTNFSAKVVDGFWLLDAVEGRFSSLNELSNAIGTKTENAWKNWFYWGENGQRTAVSNLREPNSISKKNVPSQRSNTMNNLTDKPRWCDDVRQALSNLGGSAHLDQIYKEVRSIRGKGGRTLPDSTEEVIRKELEIRSSDSDAYNAERGDDWFALPNGKGGGHWALRA